MNAAGMDETYGTYVDDECFDIHHYDDETDYDTDDDTDDGGRGDLYTFSRIEGLETDFIERGLQNPRGGS